MNVRHVLNQFGLLLVGFGGVMLILAVLLLVGELVRGGAPDLPARLALLLSGLIGAGVGGSCWLLTRGGRTHLGRREALLLVSMGWVLGGLLAALPYFMWATFSKTVHELHPFRGFENCYFEAISGLTTTGATVLGRVEDLPHSLLLWRAITQWLGGLGVIVLFVAVLPGLGVGGRKLFRVETGGASSDSLQPQIRETTRTLMHIYIGLTLTEIVLLYFFTSMPLFDAVCYTLATVSTGGFGTHSSSIGEYDGPAVYMIVIAFMILSSLNFGLYFQILRGRGRLIFKDPELRFYLVLLLVGAALVFISLRSADTQPIVYTDNESVVYTHGAAASEAILTTVSMSTTTGFVSSDYDRWPFLAQAVLVMVMLVGGCSGSTAGGIKVIRVWVALKVMLAEIEHVFRPHVIRPVKIAGGTIDDQLKLATVAYVLGFVVLLGLGTGLVQLFEGEGTSLSTAAGASVACLCTIGPGLAEVGAVGDYGGLTLPTKMLLTLLMILGRLEIFAILALFLPRVWRGE